MTVDLFAGIPICDYAPAAAWYERLLGAPPSFLPNDTEAVWELAEHWYAYIVVQPEHAVHTVFVSDFDAQIAQRYTNGVRKATFRDPGGNEIGFGGNPA